MKKSLILFSVAALALVSCAKVTDQYVGAPENREIAFQAVSLPQTKAAVHEIAMPDQNIYVAAYQSATASGTVGNYFAETTFKKDYKAGSLLTGDDKDGVWGGDPARYYPLSAATLNFLAVTGKSGDLDINSNDAWVAFNASNYASEVTVNYTAGTGEGKANRSEASQIDIMYATGQGVVTQSGNGMGFAGGGITSAENIAMPFNHALALLNFQVKAASGTEGLIQINSITINNAAYTGTLVITNANYAATDATAKSQPKIAWTPDARIASGVAVTGISNYDLTTSFYPTNADNSAANWANIMIIPSDTQGASPAARGFDSFTVTYTVKAQTGFAAQQYTYTYWPSGVDTVTNVAEGKIYTYQLTFNLHEIRVEPSVANWDEVGPTTETLF